uniref:Uncharacterized protein n=1 Tax=Caenorhabditis japonica TaxID=281687 RepID=A0A8R1I4F6_CAEJA
MTNQDRVHQITGAKATINREFFSTLEAIEEFERQRGSMWRLINLGFVEDDLEINGYKASRGLDIFADERSIGHTRTYFAAMLAEAATGLRDIQNKMAYNQVEMKNTETKEELKNSIEATSSDIEALRYSGPSGVERAPERQENPGSPGHHEQRQDNRPSFGRQQQPHRERSRSHSRSPPRSPLPKRRDQRGEVRRPTRLIYPRDYVSKNIRNSCAFSGQNHYSDTCQNYEYPDERTESIQGICCTRCLSALTPGHECKPMMCRYCKRTTDHHYSLCNAPLHRHQYPDDYVPGGGSNRPHHHAPRGYRGSPDRRRGDDHAPWGDRRRRSSSRDSDDPNVPGPSHGRHVPRRDSSRDRGGHRRESSRDSRRDNRRH